MPSGAAPVVRRSSPQNGHVGSAGRTWRRQPVQIFIAAQRRPAMRRLSSGLRREGAVADVVLSRRSGVGVVPRVAELALAGAGQIGVRVAEVAEGLAAAAGVLVTLGGGARVEA